jgi:hypothetical protein
MPLQATSGAASYDAFGGGVPVVPQYIEEVFSTYLYDGNDTARSIVNGIDLSTKGGLVWVKGRNLSWSHTLHDTARGALAGPLNTATTDFPNPANNQRVTAFNTDGFSLGTNGNVNGSTYTYTSWSLRKQPKFFDVVTYTGTGSNRTIAHSLGSTPGCVIVKRTDSAGVWRVYHQSLGATKNIRLNETAAPETDSLIWNDTAPTSTVFSLGTNGNVNASGGTYVAYVFAHDAGGFGLTGTDNVISCGSFTSSGSGTASITLGYEPQWVMIKCTTTSDSWYITDTMRGMPASPATTSPYLVPNTSAAEASWGNVNGVNATGWSTAGLPASQTFIYIAIRRGPMKVPTDATNVYLPVAVTPSGSQSTVTTNFPTDLIITTERSHALTGQTFVSDRLRGTTTASRVYLNTAGTGAEVSGGAGGFGLDSNVALFDNFYPSAGITNPVIYWAMRRAPSVMDVVCHTGTGSARTVSHNLQAVPELMLVKRRSGSEAGGIAGYWLVYAAASGNANALFLNTTDGNNGTSVWNSTTPTATTFTVNNNYVNYSGDTYVSYLFSTCAGVSKVGSYTGTATTKQIDCGFTAGARFVLIKRTDSTGAWYVWDTARGIVSGNDPYLLLNSTAAEATSTDYIDPYSAGFELSSTAPAALNASGGSYIFLAIA